MKIKLTFLLFIVVHLASAQITWVQRANVPNQNRSGASGFPIGSNGYIGLGDDQFPTKLTDLWQYDPPTNSWTQKSNFGGAGRSSGIGFSITANGATYGYAGLGWNNSSYFTDIWQYDATLDSWSQMANFPAAGRVFALAVGDGPYGYVGMGGDWGGNSFNDFWQFDPVANTWTKKTNFPSPRRRTIRFVLNGAIYAGAGEASGVFYNDFWKYDTTLNTWSQKSNYSGGLRSAFFSLATSSHGYAGAGWNGTTNQYDSAFYQYDPVADSWMTVAYFPGGGRVDGVGFSIGDTGYVGTGYHNYGSPIYHHDFWAFYPAGLPKANFTSSDTAICDEFNNCLNFTDKSTNATGWHWYFTGATPDTSTQQNPSTICYYTPGTYPVMLVVNNSLGTDTLYIAPKIYVGHSPAPPALTTSGDTIFCSHAYSYQWYYNGSIIPGATDSFYVVPKAGTYSVMIADFVGCNTLSGGIYVTATSVSETGLEGSEFNARYIPTNGEIEMKFFSGKTFLANVEIYSSVGAMIHQEDMKIINGKRNLIVANSQLAQGIYFLKVVIGEKTWVRKILIEG